jgi:hypothetical protein
MTHPKLRFRGEEFLLIGDRETGGAIATVEEYQSFTVSRYHLKANGEIWRFGQQVGEVSEIEWLDLDIVPNQELQP